MTYCTPIQKHQYFASCCMQAACWHHLSTIQCLATQNKTLNFQTDQNVPHQIFMYIKVKLSLCFIQHHTMEMYWGAEAELHMLFNQWGEVKVIKSEGKWS